jgi:hypothetical protein
MELARASIGEEESARACTMSREEMLGLEEVLDNRDTRVDCI